MRFQPDGPGCRSHQTSLLALGQVSHLPSLSLRFLICEREIGVPAWMMDTRSLQHVRHHMGARVRPGALRLCRRSPCKGRGAAGWRSREHSLWAGCDLVSEWPETGWSSPGSNHSGPRKESYKLRVKTSPTPVSPTESRPPSLGALLSDS